jgi:hypothetical protein
MADDNVTPLRKAYDRAERVPRKKKDTRPPAPPGDGGFRPPPDKLPDDSPVHALGHLGFNYFFLTKSQEFVALAAKDLGRLNIIALFGGDKYLVANWPSYNKDGLPNGEFKHGRLGPVLIESCDEAGLFDPAERVRGVGAWAEDDGSLVFHCGDVVWCSEDNPRRSGAGMRGRYLYPGAPPMPEPLVAAKGGVNGPAASILDIFDTWNFARGETDAKILLGWIGAALLGAAPEWRPMCWITGGRGTGKSTLLKLVKWIMGHHGMITSADATRAGLAQRVGNSSRPVALDELESKEDNSRARDIIALARIASSGDDVTRGSPGGQAASFTVRNCFLFSSITIPPRTPADVSRMAVLELQRIEARGAALGDGDDDLPDDSGDDPLLGSRERWERIGRELRGRLLMQWPRYRETLHLYRRALRKVGHDSRAADQFGALGAAYDLLLHDATDEAAAKAWAAALPAKTLAETSGTDSDDAACLNHLLSATPMLIRGGTTESVSHWLQMARGDREGGKTEDLSDALRLLAKIGIKVFRDARLDPVTNEEPLWWIAIANSHEGLANIFKGTQWGAAAGSSSGWPQMFKRLPQAMTHGAGGQLRLRIDKVRRYVTALPWDTVFPKMNDEDDADTIELVSKGDQ